MFDMCDVVIGSVHLSRGPWMRRLCLGHVLVVDALEAFEVLKVCSYTAIDGHELDGPRNNIP